MRWFLAYLCSSVFICGCVLSCDKPKDAPKPVVIYTSVDQPIAETVLKVFTQKTGIPVEARYDTEATKSVGLAERLRAEKGNPQADVWWGNEIFLTIGLAKDGCFTAYESPAAEDVPAKFRDPKHRWAASGMRVRMLAYSWQWENVRPMQIEDLAKPGRQGPLYMARPVAGTTTGHVAALYTLWGEAKADAFFKGLHANGIKLVGGNSMVVQAVASSGDAAGLTDNDDVYAAMQQGVRVSPLLLDQGDGEIGTLAIPCTVGLVANRPESANARKLVDYLLSKDVEQKLIDAKFVKYSVRAGPGEIRTMDVDYAKVAEILPTATRRATAILEGRQ